MNHFCNILGVAGVLYFPLWERNYLFMFLGTSEQFQFYVKKVNVCSNSLKISSTIPDLEGVNKNSSYTDSNQLVAKQNLESQATFPLGFL